MIGPLQDKLDLGEPLLPPPVISDDPLTMGWKILALGITILVVLIIVLWWQNRKINKYRREAVALCKNVSDAKECHKLLSVLKNTAMQKYGRQKVASLTGVKFSAFLNNTCKGEVFPEQDLLMAENAIYKEEALDKESFKKVQGACIKWIRKHHVRDTKHD